LPSSPSAADCSPTNGITRTRRKLITPERTITPSEPRTAQPELNDNTGTEYSHHANQDRPMKAHNSIKRLSTLILIGSIHGSRRIR
jgi:hypothetical protein